MVLNDEALYEEWLGNVKTMADRIIDMRAQLKAALIAKETPGSWEHITQHIGMLILPPLPPPPPLPPSQPRYAMLRSCWCPCLKWVG
jgi:aspartate/tyrosine/aromatic aminotransferase